MNTPSDLLRWAAPLAALLLAACAGERSGTQDAGGRGEAGAPDSGASTKLDCVGDCRDFVVDRILLPTTTAEASKYGLDVGGKKYNGLGSIISLVAQVAPGTGVQESMDKAVYGGDVLVLIKLKAADLANQAQVKAQTWTGDQAKCCTSTSDLAKCKAEAQASCFNGKATLKKSGGAPDNMIYSGAIKGGAFDLTSKTMQLQIKISNWGVLKLDFKHARLTGKITGTNITDGVLAGAIPKSDLDSTVVPELAKLLDQTYKDSTTDKKTLDLIKQLVDTDGDGSISTAEVANNALLKTILAGDVDADQDGELDLTLGVGLTAVPCSIADFKAF